MIELPAIAKAEIREHQAITGKACWLRTIERYGGCPNCNGLGSLMVSFVKAGPFANVPGGKSVASVGPDGLWYVVDTHAYDCPVCGDPQRRRRILFETSGLEAAEMGWKVDFIKGQRGKEQGLTAARGILSSIPRPTGWVLFHGDYGRGKSGLLKSIVAQACTAGCSARYITSAIILMEIRDTFGDDVDVDEKDLLERYTRYALLAVDEVDRIPDTGWSRSTLFTLLNARYDRRGECCTLLATNQDPDAMPAGMEYLASRMRDGTRVQVGGVDLRG